MTCDITWIKHPKHGPVWYGCFFGTWKGTPFFIEAYSPAAINDDPGKVPQRVAEELIYGIATAAGAQGIELQDYPELDKKRKKTDVDIVNDALTRIGKQNIEASKSFPNIAGGGTPLDQAWKDLEKFVQGMKTFTNFVPNPPGGIMPRGLGIAPPSFNGFDEPKKS